LKRGTCERSGFPSLIPLPRAARQCRPLSRVRGAFRRGSPKRAPSRAPAWSSAPAGRRAQMLHVFIDVRKPRLDRSSRAFACVSWPHALPRLLQIDVSTSTAMDRSNIPDQRNPWSGTAADSTDRCLSIEGDRRGYSGSGAEDHRASALPSGIAPGRDFAPTPIASGTSCRGHHPSPRPEWARGTDEAASAAHASKA
jgi:hypothetical protein